MAHSTQSWPHEHRLDSDSLAVVIATAGAAALSGILVLLLLGRILQVGLQAYVYRDRIMLQEPPFLWRPIGVLVTSLLLSNLLQVASGMIQMHWAHERRIHVGSTCTAQAAMLLAGDVGVLLLNMLVSAHTFCTVCLHISWSKVAMGMIIAVTWAIIILIPLLGPLVQETPERGPFYGISFEWCFINSNYPDERIYLQYIPIFVSTGVISILYLLVFLTIRGSISFYAWNSAMGIRSLVPSSHSRQSLGAAAHRMLWYPATCIVLILPLAVARLCSVRNQYVPRWVWHFAVILIYLTGTVNVLIYASSRKALSPLRWSHRPNVAVAALPDLEVHDLINRTNSENGEAHRGVQSGLFEKASVADID